MCLVVIRLTCARYKWNLVWKQVCALVLKTCLMSCPLLMHFKLIFHLWVTLNCCLFLQLSPFLSFLQDSAWKWSLTTLSRPLPSFMTSLSKRLVSWGAYERLGRLVPGLNPAAVCADSRTGNWFLMSSPLPQTIVIAIYIYFVTSLGPRIMENRKPLDLKGVLIFYNFSVVALSVYMIYEVSGSVHSTCLPPPI